MGKNKNKENQQLKPVDSLTSQKEDLKKQLHMEFGENESVGPIEDQQVMNKVHHTIFWHGSSDKIEIQGDFTNWKVVPMKPVSEGLDAPQGATHYFKKLLNPQIYTFNFVINDKIQLSNQYQQENNKNRIDLTDSPTLIYCKKQKFNQTVANPLKNAMSPEQFGSQYETLSKFIENEEIKINTEMMTDESDENFEEFHEDKTNIESFTEIVRMVNIDKIVVPKLPPFANSSLIEPVASGSARGKHSRRKSDGRHSLIPKSYRLSEKQSKDVDNNSDKDQNRLSKFQPHESQESLASDNDLPSSDDDFDLEEATQRLFSKLFIGIFEQYRNQIDLETGKIFITQGQFQIGVASLDVGDQEQIDHFMGLYDKADSNQIGRISKDQLIDAIREDLKIQLDQQSEEGELRQPSEESKEDPQTAFKFDQIDSPDKSEESDVFQRILEPRDNEPFEIAKLDFEQQALEETGEFIGFGQLNDHKSSEDLGRKSSLRDDPILKQLKLFNSKNLQGIVRCDNLRHALEYISQHKLEQYGNDPDSLSYLFDLLIENSNLMGQQFENLQTRVEKMEEMGTEEVQSYAEKNQELEGQLDLMEAELEKMRMYEQSYHTQEKRLQAALDRVDMLFNEKNNIEIAHIDLIDDYKNMKTSHEKLTIMNRTLKLEVEELSNQAEHLKSNIINQYQQADSKPSSPKDAQDIPTDINAAIPHELSRELHPTETQQAMEKLMEDEENNIISDLETTEIFKMKGRIKNYIENNVRLNRQGLKNTIRQLNEKNIAIEKEMNQQCMTLQLQNDSLFSDLKTARFLSTEFQNVSEEKQMEIDRIQLQLQQLIQENQQLRDEKVRIMEVNTILEQKVQIERSELMSLRNDFDNVASFNDGGSLNPKLSKNLGKMSSYVRKQQSTIRSMRGSSKSSYSAYSKQSMFRPKQKQVVMAQKESQMDKESYKEKMFIKYQTKKNIAEQYNYKSGIQSSDACSEGYQFEDVSNKDVIINDDQSSEQSSYIQRAGPSEKSSIRGSVRSKRDNNRVQVIDDIDSDDGSINETNVLEINEDIQEIEKNELIEKRKQNYYDLMGLQNESHIHFKEINQILKIHQQELQQMNGLGNRQITEIDIMKADEKQFYSESIKIYNNRLTKSHFMIMYLGLLYLIQVDEVTKKLSLLIPPLRFLDEINKVVYSEKYENYLSLRLRDMRKTQGSRDNIIIEVSDRELFADFIMEYAESEEDEIIFEQNEEFSMIVNSSPVWFSFDDFEQAKKNEMKRQFVNQDLTGFLEHKQNKAINYFKMMFQKNANWETKYFALKGLKLYIYKGQKYNKPTQIITLTEDMVFREVRKADVNGKNFVFSLEPGKNQPEEIFAGTTEIQYNKWISAFRNIKDRFYKIRLVEIDQLKQTAAKKETRISTNIFRSLSNDLPLETLSEEKPPEITQELDLSTLMMQEIPKQRQNNTFFQKLKTNLEKEEKEKQIQVIEYDDSPHQWLNTTKNSLIPKHSIILEDDGDQSQSDKDGESGEQEEFKSCDNSDKGNSEYSYMGR